MIYILIYINKINYLQIECTHYLGNKYIYNMLVRINI